MADQKKTEQKNTGKYFYAVGRRKTSSARVRLFSAGNGQMTVNGKDYKEYFPYSREQEALELPFSTVGQEKKYNVEIKIEGGGVVSGSIACRLGISRCLVKINENNKPLLRAAGFMTRDPRAKERKKPGLKRARRSPQWSKR